MLMKLQATTATSGRQIQVILKWGLLSFGVVTKSSDATFLSREVSGWVAESQGVK